MSRLLLLAQVLLLVGCSEPSSRVFRSNLPLCSSIEQRRELAKFIIKCSEAANPKSDEEGEDLVAQCEQTGKRTLCPTIEVCRTVRYSGGFEKRSEFGDWEQCHDRP